MNEENKQFLVGLVYGMILAVIMSMWVISPMIVIYRS